jgi:hypothetical protein
MAKTILFEILDLANWNYVENNSIIPLSPVGERAEVWGGGICSLVIRVYLVFGACDLEFSPVQEITSHFSYRGWFKWKRSF